jgi:hypothetical protein
MQDFYVTKNGEFEFFSGKINIKYKAYPIFIIHESLYKYYWDKLKRLLHQSKTKGEVILTKLQAYEPK